MRCIGVAGLVASELWPNTDWKIENRLTQAYQKMLLAVQMPTHSAAWSLSSALLNSDLHVTNGATLGACMVSV